MAFRGVSLSGAGRCAGGRAGVALRHQRGEREGHGRRSLSPFPSALGAGSVPANRDASALRTALEVLGSDSPAGRQFRCNLVQRPPEEVAVDFQLLQTELGAFIAAAASLKKVTASRQPALKIREGLASSLLA